MKNCLLLIMALAAIPALTANGADRHRVSLGHPADIDSTTVADAFKSNAPVEFSNAATPFFSTVGKNGKFIVSVGGFVKVTVGADMGHPIDSPDEFTTSQIPMRPMEGNGAQFNLSAKQSHIYLNFVALPGTDNSIGAFFSANFLDNYVPELQFAYLKYRGFQAGYDYTLFSDPASVPNTIDYEGPNASTMIPVAGIRYGVDFGKKKDWCFSVGAELPFESYTTVQGRLSGVTQRVPDIPLALQYSWNDKSSWVRLSGVIRNLYYRNVVASRNVDKVGYGLQLAGCVAITPQLSFLYQGVYGKGIASYIQDLDGEGLDLVPGSNGGPMKTVRAWGAFGGLQYTFSPKLTCSATYSHVRTYADRYEGGSTSWGDQYRYGQYAEANVIYNINSFFQTGIEYIWGRRVNYDGMKCADNRLQAMVQLSF